MALFKLFLLRLGQTFEYNIITHIQVEKLVYAGMVYYI